ncbi:MAG: hypothetical protein ABIF77_07815 [bacterium]
MLSLPDGRSTWEQMLGLLENPWSAETRQLAESSIRYLFVSDAIWPAPKRLRYSREIFDRDARFTPLLVGEEVAVYGINWVAGIADPDSQSN